MPFAENMSPAPVERKPRASVPSEALRAMGRRVAETFANDPLNEAQLDQVAQAYAELCLMPRVLTHTAISPEGQTRVFVVFGELLWVVDAGVPFCFRLPDLGTPIRYLLSDPAPFVALYAQHVSGERHLEWAGDEGWFLTSFCRAASAMAKEWQHDDVKRAFERAGVQAISWVKGVAINPHDAAMRTRQMRLYKGRPKNLPYLLRIIGAAVRVVREALDREMCRTLWSLHLPDGRLAHWVLSTPCERTRSWRQQALRAHPVMLPLWLLHQASKATPLRGLFGRSVQAFSAQVDAGHPYVAELAQGLTRANPSQVWQADHVRFMAQRGKGMTVTMVRHNYTSALWTVVDSVRHLAPARALRHKGQWFSARRLVSQLENWDVLPEPQRMEAFFKGCPTDWDDPFYGFLGNHFSLLCDAMNWVRSVPARKALFQALTFRQLINLAHRLHTIYNRHTAELQAERERADAQYAATQASWETACRWVGAGKTTPWSHQGHTVHELLSLQDTWHEGQRMQHCVGNGAYARAAALGGCRLFSIRHQGKPVSTFELRWLAKDQRLAVVQHFGRHDTEPSEVADATLKAWLQAKRCAKGPWPPDPTAAALDRQRSDLIEGSTVRAQVRRRMEVDVMADIQRRYPKVTWTEEPADGRLRRQHWTVD
jgi:hypothetical protein